MDPTVLGALDNCRQKISTLNDQYSERMMKEVMPKVVNELEPLFAERQPLLDAKEGFWATAILSEQSPTHEFCSESDAKLLRAVQSVRVTKNATVGEAEYTRRLTITLRQNIFSQAGEVHREMRSDGTTASTSNVQWKVGPQAVRGTILRVMDPATPDAEAKEIMDQFDLLFQNPVVLMN